MTSPPPNRAVSAVVLLIPILAMFALAQFGVPRVLQHLPAAIAWPLVAVIALVFVSLLAATAEMLLRLARSR